MKFSTVYGSGFAQKLVEQTQEFRENRLSVSRI